MSSTAGRASGIGDFLKARRAQLTPQDVGLPDTGSLRRVAGLRREEVARLAAISVDYYTRLEQGRVPASGAVLETLTRALRVSDDERSYLYEIARRVSVPRRRAVQQIRPAMRRLLDQLVESPAMVLGRRMDIVAWNPAAAALFVDFERMPENRRNYVRMLFTEPGVRALHVDWPDAARTSVAALRMEAARYPGDARLAALVGELSVQDADFRTWWAAHVVTSTSNGTKHYRHPLVGELSLDCDMWSSPDGSEQRLMVLTAEPSTASHEALRALVSRALRATGATGPGAQASSTVSAVG